jgi:hypothetical protein
MKCLTNEQIQQLIDGETSTVDSTAYRQHINSCSHCLEQYNDQKALAQTIKDLLNASVQSPERIPEFRIPNKIIKPKLKDIRIISWLEVAALLIPVFFICKMYYNKPVEDFKPTTENIRMYEMCNTVDANTAYQENMIITTVTDENGKVVESVTN